MAGQNGSQKTREIDPLRGTDVREGRRGFVSAIKVYRSWIEKALAEAAHPHVGGRRHMRLPLSLHEQEHHDKVDRYLGRRIT